MSRELIYDRQHLGGIPGLVSLTEPDHEDRVAAVLDLAILGAPRTGKTQFVVSAVRTLRAHAPDLDGAELAHNRELLRTVMNAREPSPAATATDSIPHYVFRVGAGSLWNELGPGARLTLAVRLGFARDLLLALAIGTGALLLLLLWRGGVDAATIAGAVAAGGGAIALSWRASRERIRTGGDIEIVFWDIAGAHVYSETSADYYGFLERLVRERRRRARPWRAYGFAPVLVCDPLSLGLDPQESSFARLRRLIPIFSALNEPHPRALIAINHFAAVARVCEPDRDRNDVVELHLSRRDEPSSTLTLPSPYRIRREVVRKLCLDSEDGREDGVDIAHLRFDAADLVSASPVDGDPNVIACEYRDGTGGLEGDARRDFFTWIARIAFGASHRPRVAPALVVDDPAEPAPAAGEETRWGPIGEEAARTLEAMKSVVEENRGRYTGSSTH